MMLISKTLPAHAILYSLAMLYIVFLSGGCMVKPPFVCHPDYFGTIEKESIGKEISRMEATLDQARENSDEADIYLRLALLYSHYDNPAPNYRRSLSMLEKYLARNPHNPKNGEILYMKRLLQALTAAEKKKKNKEKEAKLMKQKNEELLSTNAELTAEKQELQNTIQNLRLLDIMLEEKRLNLE